AGGVRDSFEERDPTARVRMADRPQRPVFGRVVPLQRACERGELEDHRARSGPLALADLRLAAAHEVAAAVFRDRRRHLLRVRLIALRVRHDDDRDHITPHAYTTFMAGGGPPLAPPRRPRP